MKKIIFTACFVFTALFCSNSFSQEIKETPIVNKDPDKLVILWTSGDKEVAMNMILCMEKIPTTQDYGQIWKLSYGDHLQN